MTELLKSNVPGSEVPDLGCFFAQALGKIMREYLSMFKKAPVLVLLLLSTFLFAAAPDAVDAGKTTGNVFESTFFHFRYEFPNGWVALDDKVRMAENKKRFSNGCGTEGETNMPVTNSANDTSAANAKNENITNARRHRRREASSKIITTPQVPHGVFGDL